MKLVVPVAAALTILGVGLHVAASSTADDAEDTAAEAAVLTAQADALALEADELRADLGPRLAAYRRLGRQLRRLADVADDVEDTRIVFVDRLNRVFDRFDVGDDPGALALVERELAPMVDEMRSEIDDERALRPDIQRLFRELGTTFRG